MTAKQEKAPGAFRTISEVADELDVPQHVLRFWESKFSQLKPVKRGGGRRYYRPEDIQLIRTIRRLLYDDKFTIKGAQKLFREQGVRRVVSAVGDGKGAVVMPLSGPAAGTRADPSPAAAAGKGMAEAKLRAILKDLQDALALLEGDDESGV